MQPLLLLLLPHLLSAGPSRSVEHGNARFSVLTPRTLRLEYSAAKAFEDRPSVVFNQRESGPVPAFSGSTLGSVLTLRTGGGLTLTYDSSAATFADGVALRFGEDGSWRPAVDGLYEKEQEPERHAGGLRLLLGLVELRARVRREDAAGHRVALKLGCDR